MSDVNASRSPELVGLLAVELVVPFCLHRDRLVHRHARLCHRCDLQLVISLLVAVKQDLLAVAHELASFVLSHVWLPCILHQHLAEVCRQASVEEVVLDSCAVQVALTEEEFI